MGTTNETQSKKRTRIEVDHRANFYVEKDEQTGDQFYKAQVKVKGEAGYVEIPVSAEDQKSTPEEMGEYWGREIVKSHIDNLMMAAEDCYLETYLDTESTVGGPGLPLVESVDGHVISRHQVPTEDLVKIVKSADSYLQDYRKE